MKAEKNVGGTDMDTDNSRNRPISSQSYALRPYEENCDQLVKLCEETGQKPSEALRDLVDVALRARRNSSIEAAGIMETMQHIVEQNCQLVKQNQGLIEQNNVVTRQCERLLERYEPLEQQVEGMKRGLIQNLRDFYAILLETLSASIGARRLAWKYVAHTVLKQSGYTEDEINRMYEDEKEAWIEEREGIARALEVAIEKMRQPASPRISANGHFSDGAYSSEPDFPTEVL